MRRFRVSSPLRIAAAGVAIGLASCSVVNVRTASMDDIRVTRGFGFVSLQVKPSAGTVLVTSTTLGIVRTIDGLALGFHWADYAAIPPSGCQVVLWIRSNEQLKMLDELLRNHESVCVVRDEQQ